MPIIASKDPFQNTHPRSKQINPRLPLLGALPSNYHVDETLASCQPYLGEYMMDMSPSFHEVCSLSRHNNAWVVMAVGKACSGDSHGPRSFVTCRLLQAKISQVSRFVQPG